MLFFCKQGLPVAVRQKETPAKSPKRMGEMMQIHVDSIGELW